MLLGAMLICIVPVLGISILSFSSASQELNKNIYQGLASTTTERLSSIERILGRAATNLESWSRLLILQDVLTDDDEGDAGNELARLQASHQYFTSLIALNDQGIVVSSTSPSLVGLDLSTSETFLKSKRGQNYQSNSIEQGPENNSVIVLAEPIVADYDSSAVIGTLVGFLDWESIKNTLTDATILGSRQDADHRLILIASTDRTVLYDSIPGSDREQDISRFQLSGLDGVKPMTLAQKKYLVGTANSKGFEFFDNPYWTLHALISDKAAFVSVHALRQRTIEFTLVAALVVFVISNVLARSIVHPLKGLEMAAVKLATGDFGAPLPQHRSDEIGNLTKSFESMRNSLMSHQTQLLMEVDEHKKTEISLRSSEDRLNAAQRLARLGHWDYDFLKGEFFGSTQLEEMCGVGQDGIKSMSEFISCVCEDDRQRVSEAIDNARTRRLGSSIDFRLAQSNGSEVFVRQDIGVSEANSEPIFGTVQDISKQLLAEQKILEMAYFDTLTGLSNRSYLMQHLEVKFESANRQDTQFALLFMDLDGFKDINDSLGHDAGDRLLVEVARRLKMTLRKSDFVARLGGDEFCIFMEELNQENSAAVLAQSCLIALEKPFDIEGRTIRPEGSIGIAFYPDDAKSVQNLLKTADSAMYAAKNAGKNCYEFYNKTMSQLAGQRLMLEQDLQQALKRNEFELLYQPQICAVSGRLVAVEALMRWNHPDRGIVSPVEFIPVLERIGLIRDVGDWVIQTAGEQLVSWEDQGLVNIGMSVNVSPLQFSDNSVIDSVANLLTRTGMQPHRLELEITESVIQTKSTIISTLGKLKSLGVSIAIDDFGTGFSCLSSLKNLPLDSLKIDREFVKDILESPESSVLCGTIIGMAQAMGYKVVAEGVETIAQARSLVGFNCDQLQGYYFSRPVKAAEILEMRNTDFRLGSPMKLARSENNN